MAKIATSKKETASTAKSASSRQAQSSASTHQQIEKLAYQFYVDRGYQDGFDREDWARAEAIVRGRRS